MEPPARTLAFFSSGSWHDRAPRIADGVADTEKPLESPSCWRRRAASSLSSGIPGSNRRHSAWEADTLPTELIPRTRSIVLQRVSRRQALGQRTRRSPRACACEGARVWGRPSLERVLKGIFGGPPFGVENRCYLRVIRRLAGLSGPRNGPARASALGSHRNPEGDSFHPTKHLDPRRNGRASLRVTRTLGGVPARRRRSHIMQSTLKSQPSGRTS